VEYAAPQDVEGASDAVDEACGVADGEIEHLIIAAAEGAGRSLSHLEALGAEVLHFEGDLGGGVDGLGGCGELDVRCLGVSVAVRATAIAPDWRSPPAVEAGSPSEGPLSESVASPEPLPQAEASVNRRTDAANAKSCR
jgi:hypothetical protein